MQRNSSRHVAVQAQIELGFERFLDANNYQAIVTHFGDLGGLKQLPGLAIQRLMEKGYGFGAEGDWKTAAMVRLMKIMTAGTKDAKGTSMLGGLYLQSGKGQEKVFWKPICWRSAPPSQMVRSASKCQPAFHGQTEKIRQDWYLLPRKDMVSQLP